MISTQETIILFIGVLILASLAVSAFSNLVSEGTGKSLTIGEQSMEKVSNSFSIVRVNEQNIIVRGEFGNINILSCQVLVDMVPVSGSWNIVYDKGDLGLLNPGDLAIFTLSSALSSGTHEILVHCPEVDRSVEVQID